MTKKRIILWAIFYVVISAIVATRAKASPTWPVPEPNGGPTCTTYIYFDGMMGCLPLFHTAMVCQ